MRRMDFQRIMERERERIRAYHHKKNSLKIILVVFKNKIVSWNSNMKYDFFHPIIHEGIMWFYTI